MPHLESAEPRPYHHGDLRRALINAALALVTEEQDWAFSLREVARRAGVSHNAPYNHFPEKRDLLGAVAAAGFEALRERMRVSVAGVADPRTALIASAKAYVGAGVENPALYRLMFGPALAAPNERAEENAQSADGRTHIGGGRPTTGYADQRTPAGSVRRDAATYRSGRHLRSRPLPCNRRWPAESGRAICRAT